MFERGGACWNASSDIAFWKVRLEMFERDGLYCFERGGHAEMLFRFQTEEEPEPEPVACGPPAKRWKLQRPESWYLSPQLCLLKRVLTQALKGRVFANRAGRFPEMEVPRRNAPHEFSQMKTPKRKLPVEVVKRQLPNDGSQTKLSKRKFPSKSPETKAPKPKIPSDRFPAKLRKRMIANDRSQEKMQS